MLKKTIKYVDFDGNERSEEYRFHLSKSELMEMELSTSGGMERMVNRIVNARDAKSLVKIFKEIILKSYGELSDDGKFFIKVKDGHKLADDFAQTEAYSELFMELTTNEEAAAEFINGIVPASLREQIQSRG